MTKLNCPKEYNEQVTLAEYLDLKGYCWCHVPNGGNRSAVTGARMKKQGTKRGVPDNFIKAWNEIYKEKGYGWDEDPWVWVIEFEVSEIEK